VTIQEFLPLLERPRKCNDGYMARCPAHGDTHPSLSIKNGGDKILLKCFAGCLAESIVAAMDLTMADLFNVPPKSNGNGHRHIVATYDYFLDGNLRYQNVRYEPKGFNHRRPDGNGGWIWNLDGITRCLYRRDVLASLERGASVLYCEGEKDVHVAESLGLVATTAGSAGSWQPELAEALRYHDLIIIPHNDVAGLALAQRVAHDSIGVAASIRVLEPLVDMPGGDLSDWVAQGGTQKELLSRALDTPIWTPTAETAARATYRADGPKPMDDAAYLGLAGDFVRLIEPETEADPAALLTQFLTAYGSAIGRTAHFIVESTYHFLNEFMVLVGETSKSRKGTSGDRVLDAFGHVDATWRELCIGFGLSSGEGLIEAVRDASAKDNGVDDKRLLIYESEFARVLKVASREGNTLSTQIRQAWDGGKMRLMTRINPVSATGAHVSIVGHITREEIVRLLNSTEAANGFANRFLWIWVHRSKFLPDGGGRVNLNSIIERLHQATEFGRKARELKRDDKARTRWHEVYPKLSEGQPGLLGAVTSRAEAHVMRLASLYALLDRSSQIRLEHLEAGLALWRYAEDSARFVFGDAMGDPLADEILRLLRQSPIGLTRTEISNLLGRHRKGGDIGRALSTLAEHGHANSQPEVTGGREAVRWLATAK